MKKRKIKGNLSYHEKDDKKNKKKNKKKEALEQMKKKDKKIRRQAKCNHIARNDGKTHFEKIRDEEGNIVYQKCKICGSKLITDKDLLTKNSVTDAGDILTTIFSLIRTKININPSLEADLETATYLIKKAPLMVDALSGSNKKKKKKDFDKKSKSKNKRKGRRKIY